MHVHYLPHLSLSYARHTNAENQTFLLLSTDYSKQLHLQTDRQLEFHTPQGLHYTNRIPRYGRDLLYDKRSAEALVPAVGVDAEGLGEVYRLNLEVGRFMRSYGVEVGGDDFTSMGGGALQGGINTGSVNTGAIAEDSHNLLAFGTSLGTVEFWDSRSRHRVGILPPPPSFSDSLIPSLEPSRAEISSLQFHPSGLTLATGSSNGLIHLYDLRSPQPLLKKDQGYGYPIHTLTFLESNTRTSSNYASSEVPKLLSADKRIIKIWDTTDGTPWTHVESAVDLHNIAWCKDSGMLLTSNEGRQQHSFFIPSLGPAPRWCSFLDNLVEEMAEDTSDPNAFASTSTHHAGEVYDNYKFVTAQQLSALGLEDKIGTSLLKPYMHGYFMRQELYEEARVLVQPEVWAERRQQSIREKIEKERESRIRGTKKAVNAKVNRQLAERMAEREEKNERRKARRELRKDADAEADAMEVDDASAQKDADATEEPKPRDTLLTDARFASLFNNEDFAIDEDSHTFRQLNPSTVPITETVNGESRKRTAVEEEEEERAERRRGMQDNTSDSDSDSGSDDVAEETSNRRRKPAENTKISSSSYSKRGHVSREERYPIKPREERGPKMQASASASAYRPSLQAKEKSFGARVRSDGENGRSHGSRRDTRGRGGSGNVVGEREMTFASGRDGSSSRGDGGFARRGRGSDRGGRGRGGSRGRGRGGAGRGNERRSASMNTFRRL